MKKGKVKIKRTSLVMPHEWYRDLATEAILQDKPIYKIIWAALFEVYGRTKNWDISVMDYVINREEMEAKDDE